MPFCKFCVNRFGVLLNPKRLDEGLSNIIGCDRVSSELYERRLYGHDLAPLPSEVSLIFKTTPDVVVKPRTTEDVSNVVKYANEHGVPVVPRGASSWGFGGTIPTKGGIVMELNGLRVLNEPKAGTMTLTVGAGARWGMILEFLEERGFALPVYPTSAPSATVGGWIDTGGLGIGSVKYGHLKENVESIVVVTPTGEVTNVQRDDPEFDTYFGSEGTLGVITESTLRIIREPETVKKILVSFQDYDRLVKAIKYTMMTTNPFFVEIQDQEYLNIKRSIGVDSPEVPVLCLFVYEGNKREVKQDELYLKEMVKEAGGTVHSEEDWEDRFNYMRIKKAGPTLLAGEVTFPLAELPAVVKETMELKEKHRLQLGVKAFMVGKDKALFMPMFLADERKRWKYLSTLPIINDITDIGMKAGGRPYGFGIWNAFYLAQVYGEEKVREMKDRKRRVDPQDIMNPGKLYKVKTKYGIPLWGRAFRLFTWILGALRYL